MYNKKQKTKRHIKMIKLKKHKYKNKPKTLKQQNNTKNTN